MLYIQLILLLWAVTITLLVLSMWSNKSKSHVKYKKELTAAILHPDYVDKLRAELEDVAKAKVESSLKTLGTDTENIVVNLQKESQKLLVDSLKGVEQQLSVASTAYLDSISHVSEEAEKNIASIETQANLLLQETISNLDAHLQQSLTDIDGQLQSTTAELTTVLQNYKNQVNVRISKIINEQSAEVLSNYLNESFSGLDLGDQQEAIIAKLEQNKESIMKDFAAK